MNRIFLFVRLSRPEGKACMRKPNVKVFLCLAKVSQSIFILLFLNDFYSPLSVSLCVNMAVTLTARSAGAHVNAGASAEKRQHAGYRH